MQIVLAALLFSTGGAAIKFTSFSSWQVAGLRSALAAVAILVVLPGSRRGWSRRGALVALSYSATLILFVSANKLTTSMNTIFLQNTAPLYVLALSPLLLAETIHARDLVVMLVIAAGLALFFVGGEPPQITAPAPVLGNILATLSGLTWALTILGFRWLGKRHESTDASLSATIIGNVITCAICLPKALPLTAEVHTPANWLVIVFLGVFQVGLAYVFLISGLRRSPAFTASILLMMEPVFNPVWTYLVHRERPGRWAILGGILILGATAFKTWRGSPLDPPAPADSGPLNRATGPTADRAQAHAEP